MQRRSKVILSMCALGAWLLLWLPLGGFLAWLVYVLVTGIGHPEHQPNGLVGVVAGGLFALGLLALWVWISRFFLRLQVRLFRLQRDMKSSGASGEGEDRQRSAVPPPRNERP
jgi:uncharacterized membrane protein YciS (DUF1049 family)